MDQVNSKIETPNWLSQDEVCELLNIKLKTLKQYCSAGNYTHKIKKNGLKNVYYISFQSLPDPVKQKFLKNIAKNICTIQAYSDAPNWAKIQADKYISIIKALENRDNISIRDFITIWNNDNPTLKTSYSVLMKMYKRYKKDGVTGLLAKFGKSTRKIIIEDKYLEYFKNLYLKQGSPSLYSCWENTLGFAIREDKVIKSEFPSCYTFKRNLEKEIPKQSIYLARNGEAAWNKKYGNYIERDYSNIICGKVWVSDHAQIDVACFNNEDKVVFPWVTAWRDFKSGKWLGWILQAGYPNSDHIFQSFYYAAEEYGLPNEIIIDNGKDYRAKDFAGGRQKFNIETNKSRTVSMLDELGVKAHFALPYNAQTKPIERDFLKIKELLSKHCVGYRGGNVVERPEILADEIKKGKVMSFDKFKDLFDDFVNNVLNKRPSKGKNLKGLSPDELFIQEFSEKITASKDALKLFCMRTSRTFTIGRNGIKDGELNITYWADWMAARTGLKIYLRRDIKNFKEAWAFRVDNDEFVGKIFAVKAVAALNAEVISKDEFKEALSIKKRNLKIAKSYIKQTLEISPEEKLSNFKAVYMKELTGINPAISKLANTNMDKAVRKNKELESLGKQDLSIFDFDKKSVDEDNLYLFETDRILEEELVRSANGY